MFCFLISFAESRYLGTVEAFGDKSDSVRSPGILNFCAIVTVREVMKKI